MPTDGSSVRLVDPVKIQTSLFPFRVCKVQLSAIGLPEPIVAV